MFNYFYTIMIQRKTFDLQTQKLKNYWNSIVFLGEMLMGNWNDFNYPLLGKKVMHYHYPLLAQKSNVITVKHYVMGNFNY